MLVRFWRVLNRWAQVLMLLCYSSWVRWKAHLATYSNKMKFNSGGNRFSGLRLGSVATSLLVLTLGSAVLPASAADDKAPDNALRVGITPEYPPLVFRQPEGTNGFEIDLAKALGKELGRPIRFVVVDWEDQIPALLERQTDIIMSGMSITKTRQLRVAFSKSYAQNQLRAIFPRKSASQFRTVDQVLTTKGRVGVIAGSSAQMFVLKNCPNAQLVPVTMRRDVAYYLTRGNRMDLFIDDTFALADIFANSEADTAYLKDALTQEELAWAVRPGDTELLKQVNAALEQWKLDGTLDRAFDRWVPYYKKLQDSAPGSKSKAASK